ncbi:MAG: RNA methyltransferase [Bacteroidia bacterium]|nr:RNA methyltransferase [Bacteroidia bacterium]MDW8159249.1 RNA methyltransferase [Bacteroidia bacterium]
MYSKLSISKQKTYASLEHKKYRIQQGLFLAEGIKLVKEAIISQWPIEAILIQENILNTALKKESIITQLPSRQIITCSKEQIQKISTLTNPDGFIAVLKLPTQAYSPIKWSSLKPKLKQAQLQKPAFILHAAQDPGNLGTLLRTALWFDFGCIICDAQTVDCFNPKVVRASMGSLFYIPVYYLQDLEELLLEEQERILAACLYGEWAPRKWGHRNWILLGNESQGLPDIWLKKYHLEKTTIPSNSCCDSLNITVAAGILAWEVFQKGNKKS